MKIRHISARLLPVVLPAAALLLFSGCKGRTLKDVQPTGETIEVTVAQDPSAGQSQESAHDTVIIEENN